jgi:hypothetical protein
LFRTRKTVFHRRGDWKRLALTAVPKVIFSEVIRDLTVRLPELADILSAPISPDGCRSVPI